MDEGECISRRATTKRNPHSVLPEQGRRGATQSRSLPFSVVVQVLYRGQRGRSTPFCRDGRIHVPRVGLDYFFISSEGVKRRDQFACEFTEEGEEKIIVARRRSEITKCIFVWCLATKTLFAHVVHQKGVDEE